MIKATNVQIKVLPTMIPVLVECPACEHTSEILAYLLLGTTALVRAGEGSCHRCGALLTFSWAKETDKGVSRGV